VKLFDGGEVALVTGGSRGIGRAVAHALAAEGVHVCVVYRTDEGAAKEVVDRIEQAGGTAEALQADVAVESDVKAVFRHLRAEHGRLDVLVCAAGITADGFGMVMSTDKFERVLRTNLTGTFMCNREAVKLMTRAKQGAIVNVASISGLVGWEGQSNYAASKGGIVALSKTLAREVAPQGVRVNVVAPGLVDTDMIRTIPKPQLDLFVHCIGLGRAAQAEEIADSIAFLASPRSSYTTGTVLLADGGLARHYLT